MKRKENKGITLIALVITVIVLLILAGVSISMLTGNNSIITKAGEAKTATELTGIKEQIEIEQVQQESKKESLRYMTVEEVNERIKDIPEEYKGKVGLYREEPVYLGKEDDEISIMAKKYGYIVINMTEEEFKYYIEMGMLEDSIVENKNNEIGRELSTQDFPETITIGSNTYSTGWYLIGNYTEEEKANNTYGSQYEELGLKDTTHAPYIVNYETGSIFSVDGMIMYQAEIPVHTFQDNNFKLTNAITYVGDTSIKTGNYYGNLYSTSLYDGPVDGIGHAKYNDNNGELQYDEDGALILDEDNAIPVLEVNNKYRIDEEYSINVTANGNIYQSGSDGVYLSTIVALSERNNHFISAVGFYKGYLHIYSYKDNSSNSHENLAEELVEKGFASIDISKYENQTLNIQVVAQRSKETKVYINGELILTFDSGDDVFTYNYATIGDLRVGRNLKFVGKIYDFSIYGVALNDSEVKENYEEARKYIE